MDRQCLVIDDVEAALALMTDVGRAVASDAAHDVRKAVVDFASRRSWTVVSYRTYVAWLTESIAAQTAMWLVLDPLFPRGLYAERVVFVRTSRASAKITIEQPLDWQGAAARGLTLGFIDDAASSGLTLCRVISAVSELPMPARRVLVCASSRSARERVLGSAPQLRWTDFVPGDWRVVHLRDVCPHLSYSGSSITTAASVPDVELRHPATCVSGNLWQVAHIDAAVRQSIQRARANVAERLTGVLGRPATVRDVSLLGPSCPALIVPGQRASADSSLAALIS